MSFLDKVLLRIRNSLWVIPSVMVVAAMALAMTTTFLDDLSEDRPFTRVIFTGGHESARAILQTVATATITFTALVFTVTIVALQLASQQFSPRVLRTFLHDLSGKFALGTFIGTFIYSLMVLRVISAGSERGIMIPSISMMVLLVLVLTSVAMFVAYISHMAHSIRVSNIIDSVATETRALLESMLDGSDREPDEERAQEPIFVRVKALGQGSLNEIDRGGLVRLGKERGVVFELVRRVGDFLAEGQVVMRVRGGDVDDEEVWRHLTIGIERTMREDVAFGLRQLVDIAERALSSSLNDPTTAVMALDQIHDVLRRLAARPFPDEKHRDEDGVVRLVTKQIDWDALITLSFSEIRQFSGSSLQVVRRALAALDDLEDVAVPERRGALERERARWEELARSSFEDSDQQIALQPDQQGIGSRDYR